MVDKSSVDPETMYRVRVRRAVPFGPSGRTILTPATDNVVKGKVITAMADEDIESIDVIETPPA